MEERSHFQKLADALPSVDMEQVRAAIILLKEARQRKSMVWIVGNGGSAATAAHFANDLVKMAGVRALALPELVPTMSAYTNDTGAENTFSNALEVLMDPEDVLVAISCSGESLNVVRAARMFENLIIFTGYKPSSRLAEIYSKAYFWANCPDITVQEDVHLAICHAIAKGMV